MEKIDKQGNNNRGIILSAIMGEVNLPLTAPKQDVSHAKPLPIADGKTALTALHEIVQARPDKPPSNAGYKVVFMHETYLNPYVKIGLATRMAVELATRGNVVPTEYGQLVDTYLQYIAEEQEQQAVSHHLASAREQKASAETLEQIAGKETFEQQVNRIAQHTRAQGMGYLEGKFPHRLQTSRPGTYQTVGGFIEGTELGNDYQDHQTMFRMFPPETHLPPEVMNLHNNPNRQVWTVKPYQQTRKENEMETGMFRKEKAVYVPEVQGKRGPGTGVQYSYGMCVSSDYDIGHRPGVFVDMNVVVPEHIAREIDSIDLEQHPDFPDLYFKALYPGLVGTDTSIHLRRQPATELFVRDLRKNPNPKVGRVIPYTKPIPY